MRQTSLVAFLLLFLCSPGLAQSPEASPKVRFVQSPGFYGAEGLALELRAEPKNAVIYYTVDGAPAGRNSAIYQHPLPIRSTTVVRVLAVTGERASEPLTGTFFVGEKTALPVISISVKPYLLFHPEDGLFVKGPKAAPNYPFTGANFWSRRELPVNVEFFEEDGRQVLCEAVGMSIFGGMSRVYPQKSVALAARKRYGPKYLKYPFFANRPFKKYKHLILRNSGSDFGNSHFRDAFITSLAEDMGLEVQAYRPALAFINGNYWGILNLREKVNRYFVANHYGVSRDSLDLIEHRQDVKFGSIKRYNQLRAFLRDPATHLANPAHYLRATAQIDVENFLNYYVLQIYADNQDAGGNIKFWRTWRPDGRWRWLLYDTDFGFGMYEEKAYQNNSLAMHTQADGPAWPNPPWTTLNLRKMLENPGFRQRFVNRFMDCMNTVFRAETAVARIDSFQRRLEPEMPRHLKRWKRGGIDQWHRNVARMRAFAQARPEWMRRFLQERWDLGPAVPVKIDVKGRGIVWINDFVAVHDRFEGLYFEKLPIEVAARPGFGYRFAGWAAPGEDRSKTQLTLTPGKGIELGAMFERLESPLENKVIINEIGFNHPEAGTWVELLNRTRRALELEGWALALNESQSVKLHAATLPAKGFAILCADTAAFRKAFPQCGAPLLQVPHLALNPARQNLLLLNSTGAAIDSMGYRLEPAEKPTTLYLRLAHVNNDDPNNWLHHDGNGTPGLHGPEAAEYIGIMKKQRQWVLVGGALALGLLIFGMSRFLERQT